MRKPVRIAAALALLGLAAGGAVIGFGLYNVSARIGHVAPVYWALHTTYEQNVRLRAETEVPPGLDDPGLIRLGAGHFDSACRFCHASPGEDQSATAQAMNPAPPHITQAVAPWAPGHLHWIVDNGVKMSGMPHWPTQGRDDDVWAVVAFLAAVPGMSAGDYAALTASPATGGPEGLGYCATCHGIDGRAGGNPHLPRLDLQSARYLQDALAAYRNGARESGIMHHAARQVPEAALPALAAWYAGQPSGAGGDSAAAAALPGAALAAAGDDKQPSCRACHGPWPAPRNPAFPNLAGQPAPFLAAQLRLWRDGIRQGGGPQAGLMRAAAADLTDAEIDALATYYAALPPAE